MAAFKPKDAPSIPRIEPINPPKRPISCCVVMLAGIIVRATIVTANIKIESSIEELQKFDEIEIQDKSLWHQSWNLLTLLLLSLLFQDLKSCKDHQI